MRRVSRGTGVSITALWQRMSGMRKSAQSADEPAADLAGRRDAEAELLQTILAHSDLIPRAQEVLGGSDAGMEAIQNADIRELIERAFDLHRHEGQVDAASMLGQTTREAQRIVLQGMIGTRWRDTDYVAYGEDLLRRIVTRRMDQAVSQSRQALARGAQSGDTGAQDVELRRIAELRQRSLASQGKLR